LIIVTSVPLTGLANPLKDTASTEVVNDSEFNPVRVKSFIWPDAVTPKVLSGTNTESLIAFDVGIFKISVPVLISDANALFDICPCSLPTPIKRVSVEVTKVVVAVEIPVSNDALTVVEKSAQSLSPVQYCVEAVPVIVPSFAFNWVWIAEVTPSK